MANETVKFFGFVPEKDIVDAIYDEVVEYSDAALIYIRNHLNSTGREEQEEEIDRGIKILSKAAKDSLNRNFDKFEIYVQRNIFVVP